MPTGGPQTVGKWIVAQGLPNMVTRYTFSAQTPSIGYATALVTKTTQAIYKTTDAGTSWQKISSIHTTIGDIISSDPTNPQDIALLSSDVPMPGLYSIQRSYNGGITWSTQSVTMVSDATVSQTGWDDSTFVVGFDLAVQLPETTAVVAFPSGKDGVHLDVNGKLDGLSINHLTLIVHTHGNLQIWGLLNTNIVGLATSDMGSHWATVFNSSSATALTPIAATDSGAVIVYATHDHTHFSTTTNGVQTATAQASMNGFPQRVLGVWLAPDGKISAIAGGDGTYLLRNGKWVKVTSRHIAMLTENAAGQPRLWSTNAQGTIIYQDL